VKSTNVQSVDNTTSFERQRSLLAKDFGSFKVALVRYARSFFAPEKLSDLSDTGLGGMFIELMSYVGDNNSFYIDHQFAELDPENAVEHRNIERHLRSAGVPIVGASPAVAWVTFAVELDAVNNGSTYVPDPTQLPIILTGTIIESNGGIRFELQDDIDFAARHVDSTLKATVVVSSTSSDGTPLRYIVSRDGFVVSGTRTSETFTFDSQFRQFRTITLTNESVTDVISVRDTAGNEYYEVESLAQDTVFKRVTNVADDRDVVPDNLKVTGAPHRFVRSVDIETRSTTIRFGGGRAVSFDHPDVPDPGAHVLPLFGKTTFPRTILDPSGFLTTNTLGIAPINTTITVDYRYGGGLSHNVDARTLRNIVQLLVKFPGGPSAAVATRVRSSIAVINRKNAVGGDAAPSIAELKLKVPAFRNAQSRVVTAADLIARVYTLPANFGRVFRVGIRTSTSNALSTQLFLINRDARGHLTLTPDSLKVNIKTYLGPFRMTSDAIDILDVAVVNVSVEYQVVTAHNANRVLVIQTINRRLAQHLDIRNMQVDQPILLSDISNVVFTTQGVQSVVSVKLKNIVGSTGDRQYSVVQHDIGANTTKGYVFPPIGGIFEVKYPNFDIVGSAV
jgi:hypothetical protein